jgi:hypothetical protein
MAPRKWVPGRASGDLLQAALAAVGIVFEEDTDPDTTAEAEAATAPGADATSLNLFEP